LTRHSVPVKQLNIILFKEIAIVVRDGTDGTWPKLFTRLLRPVDRLIGSGLEFTHLTHATGWAWRLNTLRLKNFEKEDVTYYNLIILNCMTRYKSF
jgi:hypothetical protein